MIVVDESMEVGTVVAGREVGVVGIAGTDADGGTDVVGTDVVVDAVGAGGRASIPTSNWE